MQRPLELQVQAFSRWSDKFGGCLSYLQTYIEVLDWRKTQKWIFVDEKGKLQVIKKTKDESRV